MHFEFWHELTGCSVVFDDDGRVGWAYLRDADRLIIADVWLYNRVPAPDQLDLTDVRHAPFLNPRSLAREVDAPPRDLKDITVHWWLDEQLLLADVHLRGALLARLSPGSQPGWNVLVELDGPLARVLEP